MRAAIVFALTYLLCWGSLPAPALAEMAGEARDGVQRLSVVQDDVNDSSDELSEDVARMIGGRAWRRCSRQGKWGYR